MEFLILLLPNNLNVLDLQYCYGYQFELSIMGSPVLFHFLLLSLAFSFPLSSSAVVMSKGTSLSVEKPEILTSPNGIFSAGFYSVGENAFRFAHLV